MATIENQNIDATAGLMKMVTYENAVGWTVRRLWISFSGSPPPNKTIERKGPIIPVESFYSIWNPIIKLKGWARKANNIFSRHKPQRKAIRCNLVSFWRLHFLFMESKIISAHGKLHFFSSFLPSEKTWWIVNDIFIFLWLAPTGLQANRYLVCWIVDAQCLLVSRDNAAFWNYTNWKLETMMVFYFWRCYYRQFIGSLVSKKYHGCFVS